MGDRKAVIEFAKRTAIPVAAAALEKHMRVAAGQLLTVGTYASEEFDRLHLAWIRARWDADDAWVRSTWVTRP